jgi:hypothetical protein
MVGAGDSRLRVTDSPLHKLWVYLESWMTTVSAY